MTVPASWRAEAVRRARAVRLVVLDVDGVLTDGGLYLLEDGGEAKRFHVRDGQGIRSLIEAGIPVGWITARQSKLVERRARELDISFLHQGVQRKWTLLDGILGERRLPPEACAYMGDDLVDLETLGRVGLAAAPADAHPEVLGAAHWIAAAAGGQGAVRELADGILLHQGRWEAILAAKSHHGG
ncbi:MAG: hypothetical protein HQL82_11120 [Magnetococcales bacterium]|nr:hypothetical protein [Magnetococcales bacterium]